ncbi:kinesin-like protein KIF6 isoform X1 [Gadus macrocephalus]|uniref:kinesin-like protein KIF6 isoform X1 n=1 Tax=Gadus macrocephalus TaxID=80720 RepID=UPI0028CB2293|nr:kinesin-like protein KIF6 isoform X1 [Gadus macrocephalus]
MAGMAEKGTVKETIQIFARVKPTREETSKVYSVNNDEAAGASVEFVVPKDLGDGYVNNKLENYKFRFRRVFDQTAGQEEIFETIAQPVADRVLAGYNGTIFAYGQTNSGKTFTITGGARCYGDRGIIPRTLSYLYQHIIQDSTMVYTTHISYLEIYNNVCYDLLDRQLEACRLEDLPTVTIMHDSEQNIQLRNLSIQQSANEEEALNLLFLGDTHRMTAETLLNKASTRSHCIFTVYLCGRQPGSATVRRSKLHLVDLAGSERVNKMALGGQLLTEAKYINVSLHYLEQVIISLSESRAHIPYRNSLMTSVLRDSLGGNCMTTMISTISVDKTNLKESMSTCRFAQRVALIKNEAVLNEEEDPVLLIARLKRENQSLRDELAMVTGEPRQEQLTQDEIQKLEVQVKDFLDDADPEATLALGTDLRKIRRCFTLLKTIVSGLRQQLTIIQEKLGRATGTGNELTPLSAVATAPDFIPLNRAVRGILISEKEETEKTRDQDTTAQLNGPRLSMGKEEAFEIFMRDHEDRLTIEDNKAVLKQRYIEAKGLGVQVNKTRDSINELKKQLEMRRIQRADQDHPEEEEQDPVEAIILKQVEAEKKKFKSYIGDLKTLRTEIQHVQLLMERAKVKLQKDFKEWWSEETPGPQDSGAPSRLQTGRPSPNSKPSSPGRPGSGGHSLSYFPAHKQQEPYSHVPSATDLRSFVPKIQTMQTPSGDRPASSHQRGGSVPELTPQLRDLSSIKPADYSIPLTGDSRIDDDILAFVRARQNLLQRRDTPQQ